MQVTERPNQGLREVLGGLVLLTMGVLGLWAALLVLQQVVLWLYAGQWQPVPLAAAFLSPEARVYELQVVSPLRMGGPLSHVPQLASAGSINDVVRAIAGNALGLQRIVWWFLDIALSVWMLGAAFLTFFIAASVAEDWPA